MSMACPEDLQPVMEQAQARLCPIMEVTERALTRDPAALLAAVAAARRAGWGIALDDVGADPASLALMPFLDPDVIKLDLRLIHENTDAEIAAIVNAVLAHSEQTGATILAEGIETEHHRQRALSMGATLGAGMAVRPTGSASFANANPVAPDGRVQAVVPRPRDPVLTHQ